MWEVLSALTPPAVVAAVFCTFLYKLLRKEMAPRTSDGRLVGRADGDTPVARASANTEHTDTTPERADGSATDPSPGAIPEGPERGTDPENR